MSHGFFMARPGSNRGAAPKPAHLPDFSVSLGSRGVPWCAAPDSARMAAAAFTHSVATGDRLLVGLAAGGERLRLFDEATRVLGVEPRDRRRLER